MQNQTVYKLPAILYANRYTGHIETTWPHVDVLITFDSHLNNRANKMNNKQLLGVTINKHLDWKDHVQNITSSARSTLGVLRRNLSSCPREVKERAYQALVRPKLEYSSAAWSPHVTGQINSLESVQRQAARFTNNYERTASVTEMLRDLQWDSLAIRRIAHQCAMFYKIRQNFVNIPFPSCVIPSSRLGRTTNICSYQIIQSRVNTYKYSFFVRTIPVWNLLPTTVVSANTVQQFQSLALPVLRGLQLTPSHHL